MALVWSLSLLITLFIHILYVAIHQRMLHGKTSKQKQQYPAYCSQTLANKPHQASLGKAIRITSVFLLEMKSPLLAANICIFLHLDYPCGIQ